MISSEQITTLLRILQSIDTSLTLVLLAVTFLSLSKLFPALVRLFHL